MRKVARSAFVLLVFALAVSHVLSLRLPAPARAGASPAGNGDTNGDGSIDISDALHLLLYLFQSGEAPVACAAPPETAAAIADLRSRVEALERERDCSPTHRRPDRFIDHGDGTTTDPCTGLMWMTDVIDASGDGQINQSDFVSWETARTLSDSLTANGFDDWRMPTIEELGSLQHTFGGSMAHRWYVETPFREMGGIWSSTELQNDPNQVWIAALTDVMTPFQPSPKNQPQRTVLAVRGPVAQEAAQ
jgi:hypothetical protein